MTEHERPDAAAKRRIKQALRDQTARELESLRGSKDLEATAVPLAADAEHDVDDLSRSDAAGVLTGLLADDVARQQDVLRQIDDLDVSPTDVVGPGSVIGYAGDRYLVGVVTSGFTCDGAEYLGISPDAPIYPAVEGLREGDSFSFRDNTFRLDLVC